MTMEAGLFEAIVDAMEPVLDNDEVVEIQLDNAPGHTGHNMRERINDYIFENNLPLQVLYQPANSPDLNICDLAFFNSLQSRYDNIKRDSDVTGFEGILTNVQEAFNEYNEDALRASYGHLYGVYDEILRCEGDNNYDLPHRDVRNNLRDNKPVNICSLSRSDVNRLEKLVGDDFAGLENSETD